MAFQDLAEDLAGLFEEAQTFGGRYHHPEFSIAGGTHVETRTRRKNPLWRPPRKPSKKRPRISTRERNRRAQERDKKRRVIDKALRRPSHFDIAPAPSTWVTCPRCQQLTQKREGFNRLVHFGGTHGGCPAAH